MSGSMTEAFRDFLRIQLRPLTGPVLQELEGILSQANDLVAASLEVVVQTGDLQAGLPVTVTCLDEERVPLPGGTFPLDAVIGPVVPPAQAAMLDRFSDAGVETLEVGLQVLIEWFADCWQAAGGRDLPVPASLYIPDDIEFFDLKQLSWVQTGQPNHRTT